MNHQRKKLDEYFQSLHEQQDKVNQDFKKLKGLEKDLGEQEEENRNETKKVKEHIAGIWIKQDEVSSKKYLAEEETQKLIRKIKRLEEAKRNLDQKKKELVSKRKNINAKKQEINLLKNSLKQEEIELNRMSSQISSPSIETRNSEGLVNMAVDEDNYNDKNIVTTLSHHSAGAIYFKIFIKFYEEWNKK